MSDALLAAARAHLRALASGPRQTGTEAVAAARAHCAGTLRAAGFTVAEEEFGYSQLPGRWGTPVGGAFSLALLVAAAAAARAGHPGMALGLTLVGALVVALAGVWMARVGILSFGVLRSRGVNLVATRGSGQPAVWLVAHADSKSQPVPMILRAGGITVTAVVWLAEIVLAAAQFARGGALIPAAFWPALAAAAVIATLPVIATTVGNRSAGAVDNASGVAAVLLAATLLPDDAAVGVLIPDAEELGLAGARAWCRGRAAGLALNCDGVDDAGAWTLMYTGVQPAEIIAAFRRAATSAEYRLSVRHLLPGILVDSVALHDAGWNTVTLSRGDAGTLRRIHTIRDDLRHLAGTGVPGAARLLADAALELCSWRS